MERRFNVQLDLPVISRKAQMGFWFVTAFFIILILLDCLWTLVQVFFPVTFGAPKVLLFEGIKGRVEAVPFEPLQQAISSRNLWEKAGEAQAVAVPLSSLGEFERLQLTGIFKGNQKKALFRDKQTRQTQFVPEGGTVGPVVIQEIRERSIIVRYGDVEREITVSE